MANEQRLGAVLEIRDNATQALGNVERASQQTERRMSTLAQIVERLDRQMEQSERHTREMSEAIERIGRNSERTEREVSRLERTLSRLGSVGSGALSRVGAGFGSVLSKVTQLTTLAATLSGGAAIYQMFKGGAALEQYQLNTKLNLQNWNGLSDTQAQIESSQYLGAAQKYANYTPFATDEVMASANRAVAVAQGDTDRATRLYKFAGDMASAVPGKTIEMAMEAIADAMTGEYERLKEFGVKLSADDLKKHFGMKGNQVATSEQQLAFFDYQMQNNKSFQVVQGRAEALSQTAYGKWSTFVGNTQSGLSQLGLNILERLNDRGVFDRLIDNSEKFAGWLDTISDRVAEIAERLATELLNNGDQTFSRLMDGVENVLDETLKLMNGETTLADVFEKWLTDALEVIEDMTPEIADAMLNIGAETTKGAAKGLVKWATPDKLEHGPEEKAFLKENMKDPFGGQRLWNWITSFGKEHATGLPNVPFDGYPATLHQGEMVLTRNQANQLRRGGTSAVPNITINVSGNNFTGKDQIDYIVDEIVTRTQQAAQNFVLE